MASSPGVLSLNSVGTISPSHTPTPDKSAMESGKVLKNLRFRRDHFGNLRGPEFTGIVGGRRPKGAPRFRFEGIILKFDSKALCSSCMSFLFLFPHLTAYLSSDNRILFISLLSTGFSESFARIFIIFRTPKTL